MIDWEKPAERIYLAEHEFLVDLLKRAGNVVNRELKSLTFSEGIGHLGILLTKLENAESLVNKEPYWKSTVQLVFDNERFDEFQLLNEETAIVNQQIFDIQPLGGGFKNLPYFTTEIKESDTTVFFLSLIHI